MIKAASMTLNTKVIGLAATVGLLVALLAGTMMYWSTVAPTRDRVERALVSEMQVYITAQIELKIQSGIMGATAFTLNEQVIEAVTYEDRALVLDMFARTRDVYRGQSIFQNIALVLFTADGRIMVRSWDLDNYGQDATDNPILMRSLTERKAFADLGVGARGVGVSAISPVLVDGQLLGMVSLIQGLFSVGQDFRQTRNGEWLLLVDDRYVADKYGGLGMVANNRSITDIYRLANNQWFNADAEATVREILEPIMGEDSAIYLRGGHLLVDLPAYDEEGVVFGRHIFLLDENELLGPMAIAMRSAWLSLFGVVFAITALTVVLVLAIRVMVISPLRSVQDVADKIVQQGDFSLRNAVLTQDEVGKTSAAINHILDVVGDAINEANQTVGAIAQGNFNRRMTHTYVGDLKALQEGINHSADTISAVLSQFGRILQSMRDGEFQIEIRHDAKGDFLTMMETAQTAMNELHHITADINQVMGYMANGEFGHRVEVQARGDMAILKNRVNGSMEQLNQAIADINRIVVAQSEGDLTQAISAHYEGDLRTLKDAVNQSVARLSEIVSHAVQAADVVDTASDEVAKGASDLSQRVQEQAASLEQTSATMEEMNSSVRANSESAQQAVQIAGKVQDQATRGQQVMQQTIAAMNSIQDSSQRIAEIVSLIDGIAFQTNLLALNAAVEAARAGDHGRGFAVVAGEVRTLAQKSADAAKDIKRLIDESVARINDGTHLASESGKRLSEMVASIEDVTEMVNKIARASTAQAQGVLQVHNAITDMDSATQQNAALVEQTSAAAESMGDQASALSRNMAFFKTASSGTHAARGLPPPAA